MVDKATVRDLIRQLVDRFGRKFQEVMVNPQNNEIKRGFVILKNGQNIEALEKLETRLNENDLVAILPLVAGG